MESSRATRTRDYRIKILLLVGGVALVGVIPHRALAKCGSSVFDGDSMVRTKAAVDAQCPCADAVSASSYLNCARDVLDAAVTHATLRKECRSSLLKAAKRSTCGRPGAVTCCMTTATGNHSCTIKSAAASCAAPSGGTAAVGSTSSCLGACAPR